MEISVIEKCCDTYWVRIFSSGDLETAKRVMRAECLREGLCVTIEPTHYIYTGGEETGFVIGLINYPRFPASRESIWTRGEKIARLILAECGQHSILIMDNLETRWLTIREPA